MQLVDRAVDGLRAHVDAHRQHALRPGATGSSSPAVSRLARYLRGMRSERTSGMAPSLPILPASAADWMGESGGTYHTIGSVRYSGCSGKATFHSIAIFQVGDLLRRLQPGLRNAVGACCAMTAGSFGSRKIESWAS